jgi:peroxiredoxin Q/BCP
MQDYHEPKVGEQAPNFRLPSTDGKAFTLEDFGGKDLILYFYPKDDTPGCTKEACAFRDLSAEFQKAGTVVAGVSTDDLESHRKFREKYSLNFPLLSDRTADVAKMFGAWKERNLNGRRSWGVARKTIWIGPDGRIRKIYDKVDPTTHGEQILRDLSAKS